MRTPPIPSTLRRRRGILSITLGIAAAALLTVGNPSTALASTAGIYGADKFYNLPTSELNGLRASGMTTMFLFTLQIRANGDFYYNGTLVAQNGNYVGDPAWRSRLDACRAMPTSITRMEMCIGSAGSESFVSIRDRIAADGTGPNTILYRNMLALKNALGFEAVQYDDEKTYHVSSAVAFGNMCASMGLKVTLCPFHWGYRTYWQSVASQLGSTVCDAIYLQCYDGGAGNNPNDWNALFGRKVMVGYWWRDGGGGSAGLAAFTAKMAGWRSTGATGGFLWTDDVIGPNQMGQYAEAIHTELNIGNDATYQLVNRKSLLALQPSGGGSGNGTQLHQWYYSGSNSFRWKNYNNSNGHRRLFGIASGRAITVRNGSINDNAEVELYDYNSSNLHQKYTAQYQGQGYYTLNFVHSGKSMTVEGASTAPGAKIIQYTNNGGTNAQWQFRHP